MMSARPPRIAELLIGWCVDRDSREFALGDLAQEYAALRASRGPLAASCWYWWQTLRIVSGAAGDLSGQPEGPPHGRRRGWAVRFDALRTSFGRAARGLWRSPGFALGVVLTLALGIGVNAAMFDIVDRLMLSPPPHIQDAGNIKRLYRRTVDRRGAEELSVSLTYPDYVDLTHAESLSAVGASDGNNEITVGEGVDAIEVQSVMATSSYFDLLGVTPQVGRFFAPQQDRVGEPLTAVLGDDFWRSHFGGDPDVVGTTLVVAGVPVTIIGVAPRGFTGVDLQRVDVWLPLHAAQQQYNGSGWESSRTWYWLRVVGRLADGATTEQAEAELTALHRAGRDAAPTAGEGLSTASILPAPLIIGRGPRAPGEALLSTWLTGVAAVVLLIACANVASLLLVRDIYRKREAAVRLALGVSRRRLALSVFAETTLLALFGAVLGMVLALITRGRIHALLMPEIQWQSGLDARMIAFTVGTTIATALLAGCIPAVLRAGARPTALRGAGGSAGRGSRRVLAGLLIAQTALSVTLLVGAGLFVRSLRSLDAVDLGLEPEGLGYVRLRPAASAPASERLRLFGDSLAIIRGMPGVQGAAIVTSTPFRNSRSSEIRVPGLDALPTPPTGGPYFNTVSPEFFAVAGMHVTRGRAFDASDTAGAPAVAIVSESMAAGVWPGRDPLGQCIVLPRAAVSGCVRIVGVVADQHRDGIVEDVQWFYYLPIAQGGNADGPNSILFRAEDPRVLAAPLRREILARVAGVDYVWVQSMEDLLAPELRPWRLGAAVFTLFGLLALAVAGVGLYSVLGFMIATRQQELGIRSALGASCAHLSRLVLLHAMCIALIGTALGALVARAVGTRIEPLLYGVSSSDAIVYGGVTTLLLLVALLAAAPPARRAGRADPQTILRAD